MPTTPRKDLGQPDVWYIGSHSYCDGNAGAVDPTGRLDNLFAQRLDLEFTNVRQLSVAGSRLTVEGASQGGWATFWRVTQTQKFSNLRGFPYVGEGGAFLGVWGINDLGTLGGATAQIRAAYVHAVRAVISRWRASFYAEDTAATGKLVPTYGGTWTAETSQNDRASNGTWRYHATTGGTITLTLPSDYQGEPVCLNFVGRPGTNGGTVTFSGTALASSPHNGSTISTNDVMPAATLSNVPVVKRITGLSSAQAGQTVIATVTANVGIVYYDCAWLESLSPPPVIWCNIARLPAAGYSGSYPSWTAQTGSLDSDVTTTNSDVAAMIASEFDGMVQIADLDGALNKDANNFWDNLHPNETGAARCADAIEQAVARLSPKGTYGTAAQMSVPAQKSAALRIPSRAGFWYAPEHSARTTYTAVAGHQFCYPFYITESRTSWTNWGVEVTTASATTPGTIRFGLYRDTNYSGYPDVLLQEITVGGALSMGTTTGSKTSNGGGYVWRPNPGLYWLVVKIETIGSATNVFSAMTGPNRWIPQATTAGLFNPATYIGYQLTGQAAGAFPTVYPTGGVQVATGPALMMLRG
jgi:hypothetical protein